MKKWKLSIIATLLAFGFCYLFYIVLDVNVLDHLSKQDSESDVINYYYRIYNRNSDDRPYTCFYDNDVAVFDLKGEKSRREIADAMKKIGRLSPEAIFLDVIFPENSTTDPQDDIYLQHAVDSLENIYAAVRLDNGRLEESFFMKNIDVNRGLVNKSSHCRPYEIFEGDTLWYMPYMESGKYMPENARRLVDYRDKAFDVISITDTLTAEDIASRIVLVGDMEDLRDKYDMPFQLDGEWRVSGVKLLAHHTSTVIHGSWVKLTPRWIELMIALLVCFPFTWFCYRLQERSESNPWNNFIETGSRLLLILVFLLAGYLFFVKWNLIVNMVYVILTTAFTGFAMNIIDVVIYTCKKKRKNE